jgi:hypothetical protein
MLMTYGLATTLCCRGLEIKAAYKIWYETESGDHRLAGCKQNWENLVTKEKTLLAERRDRQQQLAGGLGPRLASTPTPSLVSRFRQRIILHATQRPQRSTCQPRPSAV